MLAQRFHRVHSGPLTRMNHTLMLCWLCWSTEVNSTLGSLWLAFLCNNNFNKMTLYDAVWMIQVLVQVAGSSRWMGVSRGRISKGLLIPCFLWSEACCGLEGTPYSNGWALGSWLRYLARLIYIVYSPRISCLSLKHRYFRWSLCRTSPYNGYIR